MISLINFKNQIGKRTVLQYPVTHLNKHFVVQIKTILR